MLPAASLKCAWRILVRAWLADNQWQVCTPQRFSSARHLLFNEVSMQSI